MDLQCRVQQMVCCDTPFNCRATGRQGAVASRQGGIIAAVNGVTAAGFRLSCSTHVCNVLTSTAAAAHLPACCRCRPVCCSEQLDTPLHAATLLSMLKMAQQLAAAEADLQEQSDVLEALERRADRTDSDDAQQQILSALQAHRQEAMQAALTTLSPPTALLRISRAVYGGVLVKGFAAVRSLLDGTHGVPMQQLAAHIKAKAEAQNCGAFEMATTSEGVVSTWLPGCFGPAGGFTASWLKWVSCGAHVAANAARPVSFFFLF
jgi:hypothetical protein